MIKFLRNIDASAAIEAAIFVPIFVILTFGVADLGTGMFARMTINAAAQAGASYAVFNSATCESVSPSCLSGIQNAMNQAIGNSSFCTSTSCTATISTCGTPASACLTVTASSTLVPLLPSAVYSWAASATISSSVIVRIA